MKSYTTEELAEVLRLHKSYLAGDSEGVKADLSGVDVINCTTEEL